ncbi:MAG: hypothetical protein ACFCVK_10400 [Acidimicrobiales bacterium]
MTDDAKKAAPEFVTASVTESVTESDTESVTEAAPGAAPTPLPGAVAGAALEAALGRQEQIWANMYGPAGATERLERARRAFDENPDAVPADVFRSLDDEDGDLDEAGLSRPGFG